MMRRIGYATIPLRKHLGVAAKGLRKYLGFRGAALILFGLMYTIIGIGAYFSQTNNPQLFHTTWPRWLRVSLWAATGVFAVIACLINKWRIAGFVALFIPTTVIMCSFVIAVIIYSNWLWITGAAVYLLLTLVVMLLSAWPEPTTVPNGSDTMAGDLHIMADDLHATGDDLHIMGDDLRAMGDKRPTGRDHNE